MRGFLLGVAVTPAALLVAALGAATAGLWPVSAVPEPGALETRAARFALDAALARIAPRVAGPVPPTAESPLAGRKAYRDNCGGATAARTAARAISARPSTSTRACRSFPFGRRAGPSGSSTT